MNSRLVRRLLGRPRACVTREPTRYAADAQSIHVFTLHACTLRTAVANTVCDRALRHRGPRRTRVLAPPSIATGPHARQTKHER